jgi:hypothetical protein
VASALLDTDILSEIVAHYQRLSPLRFELRIANWRRPEL